MKVLISAGGKTQNIINSIASRFSSGGVDFIVIPFIENIEDIYQRGEYFDKAIILEPSWNHDFVDEDEFVLRQRINDFANQSSGHGIDNVSFVFLAQTEESAFQVYEETLIIQPSSVVLVKQPNYSVKFFVDLIKTEIDKFSDDLVYKPEVEEEVEIEQTPVEVEDKPQVEYQADYQSDLFDDIGEDSGIYNGNRLPDQPDQLNISSFNFNKDEPEEVPSDTTDGWIEPPSMPEDPFSDIGDDFEDQPEVSMSGEIPNMDGEPRKFGIDIEKHDEPKPSFEQSEVEEPPVFVPQVDGWEDTGIPEPELYPESGSIPDYSGEDNMYDNPMREESVYDTEQPQPDQYPPDQQYQPYEQPYEQPYPQPMYQSDDVYGGGQEYGETPQQDSIYGEEQDIVAPSVRQPMKTNLDIRQIRATLDAFANRGNSLLITGCGGCGTSTVALNLANVINKLGYTVLLVDLDTKNKAQSYISKSNFDCMESDSAALLSAINSTSGINAHIAIVETGFHLLTMGMGSDSFDMSKMVRQERISRFINLAKNSHNFVIYDIPFETAVGFGKDFTFMADNVVITVDCSNWGISKTMLNMCNIEDDDMYETIFNRGQLLFNRYRVLNKVMGRKVKTAMDITKVMDFKLRELLGEDPGYYFQSMHICGLINDDQRFEDGWFNETQYSDTQIGYKIFTDILKNIVLKS